MVHSFRKPISSDDGDDSSDSDDSFAELEPVFYPPVGMGGILIEDDDQVDNDNNEDGQEPDEEVEEAEAEDDVSFSLGSESSTNSENDPEEFEDDDSDSEEDVLQVIEQLSSDVNEVNSNSEAESPERCAEFSPQSPEPEQQNGHQNDNELIENQNHEPSQSQHQPPTSDNDDLSSLDDPSDHEHDIILQPIIRCPRIEVIIETEETNNVDPNSTTQSAKRKLSDESDDDEDKTTGARGENGECTASSPGPVRPLTKKPQLDIQAKNGLLEPGPDTDSESQSPACVNGVGADVIEDEEQDQLSYSNPMVTSSDDEALALGSTLAGDKIGNTTYSERHVIKTLIKWYQELPKYSIIITSASSVPEEGGRGEEDQVDHHSQNLSPSPPLLDRSFKKELTILWDMSSETDVIEFLVEKDVFDILCSTIEQSKCERLTEIALGLTSNLLSSIQILDKFQRCIDPKLSLIEKISALIIGTSRVPPEMSNCVAVLIQGFCILRRISWYLRNKELVESWTIILTSAELMTRIQFLLKSSTNVHLLIEIIHTLLQLLESLSSNGNDQDCESGESSNSTGTRKESQLPESPKPNFAKFYEFIEPNLIKSLTESLFELFKSIEENTLNDTVDFKGVPEAICAGLNCLNYFERVDNRGKEGLRTNATNIFKFLQKFHTNFLHLCPTEIELQLQNFVSSINMSLFLQYSNTDLDRSNVINILQCGREIRNQEEFGNENEEETQTIVQILHQFIIEMGRRFHVEWMEEIKMVEVEGMVKNDSAEELNVILNKKFEETPALES